MADLPRYEKWALLLTAGFVLFTGGWFLAGHSSPEPYTITAARPDGTVASASQVAIAAPVVPQLKPKIKIVSSKIGRAHV